MISHVEMQASLEGADSVSSYCCSWKYEGITLGDQSFTRNKKGNIFRKSSSQQQQCQENIQSHTKSYPNVNVPKL